jgi:hypothetical protein
VDRTLTFRVTLPDNWTGPPLTRDTWTYTLPGRSG